MIPEKAEASIEELSRKELHVSFEQLVQVCSKLFNRSLSEGGASGHHQARGLSCFGRSGKDWGAGSPEQSDRQ